MSSSLVQNAPPVQKYSDPMLNYLRETVDSYNSGNLKTRADDPIFFAEVGTHQLRGVFASIKQNNLSIPPELDSYMRAVFAALTDLTPGPDAPLEAEVGRPSGGR
jgi:Na+-transporting NADH:ubiquinone oxidoreductase subunit NqrA